MTEKQVDILVIGGGLTGATLLLGLQKSGYKVLLVDAIPMEARVDENFDARTLALAPASVRIFESLQLWAEMKPYATPVKTVQISEAGCFGATRLSGEGISPLGYVLEMQHIQQALYKHLNPEQLLLGKVLALDRQNSTLSIQTKEKLLHIKASLIVAADGAESFLRKSCDLSAKVTHYNQQAITANIGLKNPHDFQAFERFTKEGALALLPMQGARVALIWSLETKAADKLMQLSDKDFLKTLQQQIGYRLGPLQQLGKRSVWTLRQTVMPVKAAFPVVFIGNASQTLHPVAAQGFNLGLRDVATLLQSITEQGLNASMLVSYQTRRAHDQQIISYSTHWLAELFSLRIPGIAMARSAGLMALDKLPFMKKFLSRYAKGYGGYLPDLLCESSDSGDQR